MAYTPSYGIIELLEYHHFEMGWVIYMHIHALQTTDPNRRALTSKYGIKIVRLIPKESFSNKHLTRINQFHELWENIHGDNFIR